MKTTLEKAGQNKREAVRSTLLARRMVGMYRLVAEQRNKEGYNSIKSYVEDVLTDSSWRRFRLTVFKKLNEMLLNDQKIAEMIKNNTKDTGSLKDLLWIKDASLPKQSVSIRIGKIMEVAMSEFLSKEYIPYNKELDESIKSLADYSIQRDVSVRKGNTVIMAELKYNLNLDTEKASAVVDKLDMLNIAYKDMLKTKQYKTNICLVSLRYPHVNAIPTLKPVLEGIREEYIVGYEQFFNFFGVKVTETMWRNLHKKMAEEVTNYFDEFITKS